MIHKIALVARILLGLMFTVFGINFFIPFLPTPPSTPAEGAFLTAMFNTGYFFPVLKTLEVVTGLLLLANLFVPLALILLAPIVFQIFFFHLFLNGIAATPMAIVMIALGVIVAYSRKESFASILKAK